MWLSEIKELHKFSPKTKKISVKLTENTTIEEIQILYEFKQLEHLSINITPKSSQKLYFFTRFIENFKENNIKYFKLNGKFKNNGIQEFYKAISENFKLVEFDRVELAYSEEESKSISYFMKNNTSLKLLNLNCTQKQKITSQ
jgi:ATP-dependent Lon protease